MILTEKMKYTSVVQSEDIDLNSLLKPIYDKSHDLMSCSEIETMFKMF
jgi:hypothetical protein